MPLLVPVAENLWSVRSPLAFFGLQVGTRMTVVKLSSGGLLLHSPIAIPPELKAEIDALGTVRHIVAPNSFHHLYAGPAKALWPQALLHGPKALQAKRKDLAFDAVFSEATAPADWSPDLVPITIEGSLLGETMLYHPATRTLITADLVENFHHHDHAPTRWYLKLGGIYGRAGWHPLLRLTYVNRKKARASMARLLALPFERVIVAHGDNVERDAQQTIRDGLRWLL